MNHMIKIGKAIVSNEFRQELNKIGMLMALVLIGAGTCGELDFLCVAVGLFYLGTCYLNKKSRL